MKELIKSLLPRSVLRAYLIRRGQRFGILRKETEGLLDTEIYEELHRRVLSGVEGPILEIGTASGTAPIAMALALKSRKSPHKIFTVDRFVGGTRAQYGSVEDNIGRFRSFAKKWNVDRWIDLHVMEVDQTMVQSLIERILPNQLSGLILDADGSIHRDLFLFNRVLSKDTFIFIDDYHPDLTPKHQKTYVLVNYLSEQKYIEFTDTGHNSIFAKINVEKSVDSIVYEQAEELVAGFPEI